MGGLLSLASPGAASCHYTEQRPPPATLPPVLGECTEYILPKGNVDVVHRAAPNRSSAIGFSALVAQALSARRERKRKRKPSSFCRDADDADDAWLTPRSYVTLPLKVTLSCMPSPAERKNVAQNVRFAGHAGSKLESVSCCQQRTPGDGEQVAGAGGRRSSPPTTPER
ncbi:hypothetical protein PWT90_10523 [Aphanocladium album]|nr:hypothetical protein PWT90_10523 [Aphanocladium album]